MTHAPVATPRPGAAPVVIVGAGLAGLVTALHLSPVPCLVLAAGRLGEGTASGWAQGGLAAAVGDDDSPALHARDTLAAGAGLCDPPVVDLVTAAAPDAVDRLARLGARFDRSPAGRYRLGLEGAHSRRRIVHARGDATGTEILRAVVAAVRARPSVTLVEHALARRVLVEEGGAAGRVVGVLAEIDGRPVHLDTDRVVLATGGSGQLWQHTTNPPGARGSGLALAARAGAELRDLEMVQFHPTALDVGLDPMPLVSEAVRGAGALLVDGRGAPLVDDPLAARDVVARAVGVALDRGERVYVDARAALGEGFAQAFPTVAGACLAAGVNPATDLVPVHPAAHYHCGGVTVDRRGRTTVPGLWAVGEVASTGLHGANRLASNSLLEAVVCAGWAGDDLRAQPPVMSQPCHIGRPDDRRDTTAVHDGPRTDGATAGTAAAGLGVRALMSRVAGLLRDGPSLEAAQTELRAAVGTDPDGATDDTLVALMVVTSALRREESRGGHARLDHPRTSARAMHTTVTLADVLAQPHHAAAPECGTPLVTAGGPR